MNVDKKNYDSAYDFSYEYEDCNYDINTLEDAMMYDMYEGCDDSMSCNYFNMYDSRSFRQFHRKYGNAQKKTQPPKEESKCNDNLTGMMNKLSITKKKIQITKPPIDSVNNNRIWSNKCIEQHSVNQKKYFNCSMEM